MKNVITSKCCSIPQILLQILTREGETYRLIYNLSTFGGVRSLKIHQNILALFQRSCLTSYSKLCNENVSLKTHFTDSMTVDDTIDISHYLQNVVVFMYVVHDMVVKRFYTIYISTKCSAFWIVFFQGLMRSRKLLDEWPALACSEHR